MGVLTPQHPLERLINGNEEGHVGWIGCVVIVFIARPKAEWCLGEFEGFRESRTGKAANRASGKEAEWGVRFSFAFEVS